MDHVLVGDKAHRVQKRRQSKRPAVKKNWADERNFGKKHPFAPEAQTSGYEQMQQDPKKYGIPTARTPRIFI